MDNTEETPDSQPDDSNGSIITWDEVAKEKCISTRKEKQLDKLHKDLHPLTKEYEETPHSKIRHSSFQKNNQFTVITAEFLNLSSKNELNRSFDSGFSKLEIEHMLETKYQEKKKFFTELGIKHHRFKRKSFSSWITMTNSHNAPINTFMSEEELFSQLDKRQQLQLKRINNRPLKQFLEINSLGDTSVTNTPTTNTPTTNTSIANTSITDTSIPTESGLLPCNISNKEIVTTTTKTTSSKIRKKSEASEGITEEEYANSQSSTFLKKDLNLEKTTENSISNISISDDDENNNMSIEYLYSQENLNFEGPILDAPKHIVDVNDSILSISSSTDDLSKLPPVSNKRSFRNRTIVNRNPYLVDRAQFYGLATKDELLHMEERGLSELEIVNYLESEYQNSRNKKLGGYETFIELINDQKVDRITAQDDTQTFIPLASDAETDFSLDEDEEEIEVVEDVSSKNKYFNDRHPVVIANENNTTAAKLKNKKTKPKNLNKLDFFSGSFAKFQNGSNNKSQKKLQSSHRISADKPFSKKNQKKITDPYNIDFLTLSDDDLVAQDVNDGDFNIEQKVKQKQYFSNKNTISDPDISLHSHRLSHSEKFSSKHASYPVGTDIQNIKKSLDEKSTSPNVCEGLSKRVGNYPKSTQRKKRKLEINGAHNLSKNWDKTFEQRNCKQQTTDLIGGYYAPTSDKSFLFHRKPNMETIQLERTTKEIAPYENISTFVSLDIQNAKGTCQNIEKTGGKSELNHTDSGFGKLFFKWKSISENNIDNKRLAFILQLKPTDFDDFTFNDKLVQSPLIQRTLNDNDTFYRKKSIKLEFMDSTIIFDVPLKLDSLSKIVAFLNSLYGSIINKKLNKHYSKQLRKALIHVMMVIYNMKKDCIHLVEKVGFELNHFLNKIKKIELDEIIMCNICIFHMFYFIIILKILPKSSECFSSFHHSKTWLESKYLENFLKIPFESIFINKKPIVLSTLILFMKSRQTDEAFLLRSLNINELNVLNSVNLFYFMSKHITDFKPWNIVDPILNFYDDSRNCNTDSHKEIKNLFIFVHKLCCDFKWDIEGDLLVKMFRILAENKFENIGSLGLPKPTLYPNSISSIGLVSEDGCLDIYFKLSEIFSKQYMTESSRSVIERLIPVRSTFEYTDIQLQNRAKLSLIMSSIFDQDLNSGIESILLDMIRSGKIYSIRAALGLLHALIRNSSRKPYNIVRKYFPLLVRKINKIGINEGIRSILKDLMICIIVLLDGETISYLNRLLDFLTIVSQSHDYGDDTVLNSTYNRIFTQMLKQFEFIDFGESTAKDKNRLNTRLQEIICLAKTRLTDSNKFTESKKLYIKLWVFSSSKLKQSVAQLVYSEWHYFSDIDFRTQYEVKFYESLVQYFDFTAVLEDILIVLLKNIVTDSRDLTVILTVLLKNRIVDLENSIKIPLNKKSIIENKYSITRSCSASLFKMNNEKLIDNVMREFISTLKAEYMNFHSREYVKETCLYIFNVTSSVKRYDFSDWDFFVDELKLGNKMHSITRKLQFIRSTDDIAIILEKSYISNILNHTVERFAEQFNKYTFNSDLLNENIVSLCAIISYHVNEIMKSNEIHWIHLEHWIKYFTNYCQCQSSKISMKFVLNVLLILPKLKMMFATSYKYRYYYYCIIAHIYRLLDWITSMFIGFDDFPQWLNSIWIFASVDINVNVKTPTIINKVNINLERKLHHLFSSLITQDKLDVITDEKKVYDLEAKLPAFRNDFIAKWGITE